MRYDGPVMKLTRMCGCLLVCMSMAGLGAACKSSSESETVTRSPVKAIKDAGAPRIDAPAPLPTYTAEQQATYRTYLRKGRKYAKTRHYGEASRALEKALEAMPTGARALSELGWAAFQTGDYARARMANQDAIRWARDPALAAASMYNLGRLAEAVGDREEAARQYQKSLSLRPNDAVQKRLNALSQAPETTPPPERAMCGPFKDIDALCRCVAEQRGTRRTDKPLSCQRESRDIPGVELLFVGDDAEEWVYLIHRKTGGWSAVAVLGYVFDAADTGVHEELEIARFEIRKIQEREVLWVETVQTRTQEANDERQAESSGVHSLVLCPFVESDSVRSIACPLEIPLTDRYERKPGAALKGKRATPVSTVRELSVEVRDDGTVKVVLVRGEKNDAIAPLLGEHRLW